MARSNRDRHAGTLAELGGKGWLRAEVVRPGDQSGDSILGVVCLVLGFVGRGVHEWSHSRATLGMVGAARESGRASQRPSRRSSMVLNRQPPFDRWPVQHVDPNYGYVWYCGRGLVVSHVAVTRGTVEAANAYHDHEEHILKVHAAEVKENGGLFVIHDWRAMETNDAEARRVWQARMAGRHKGYLRGSIVCLVKANPLLRMAVQAANLVASVSQGAKVELTRDIERALREHGATPPSSESRRLG